METNPTTGPEPLEGREPLEDDEPLEDREPLGAGDKAELFERFTEVCPCAITVFDREGRVQYWSPAAERLFGWRAEEVLNRPPPILPEGPPDRPVMEDWQGRKLAGEGFRGVELRPVRKDGTPVDVQASSAPLTKEDGTVTGSLCVLTDITDRKEAETELEETRRRLAAIVRLSPDAIWLKDREGRYLLANPAAAGIFGLRPEDVHGRTDRELFDSQFAEEIEKADRRVVETGAVFTREVTLPRNGKTSSFLTLRYPYVTESGEVLGVIGIARDITNRKRMEIELRETRDRLEALVRASPVAIDIVDADGNVTLWNPAAEELFGWKESEVLGGAPPMFPAEEAGMLQALIREIIERGRARTYRALRRRKDGSTVEVRVWAAPVVGEGGRVHGAVGLFLDYGERRRLEEEHRRYAQVVAHLEEAVVLVDPWGKVHQANDAARRLLHLRERSDLRGAPLAGFFPVDAWARIWHRGRALADRQGAWHGEATVRGQNGDDRPVQVTLLAHREFREDEDGESRERIGSYSLLLRARTGDGGPEAGSAPRREGEICK